MGNETKISWCHASFNPWEGCQRWSEECEQCYAEYLVVHRFHLPVWGPPSTTERKRTGEATWKKPEQLNRECKVSGVRKRIFCASLADVFEDHPMLPLWREDLWKLIERCTSLDWMLLTKRPENILRMVPETWKNTWPNHVWQGTTIGLNKYVYKRLRWLVQIPAPVLFLSIEPQLEDIDLTPAFHKMETASDGTNKPVAPRLRPDGSPLVNFVITGGESQNNAAHHPRPYDLSWARSVVEQTRKAGAKAFVKQMGDNPVENGKSLKGKFGYKGSDFDSFPEDLRIREFPEVVL